MSEPKAEGYNYKILPPAQEFGEGSVGIIFKGNIFLVHFSLLSMCA